MRDLVKRYEIVIDVTKPDESAAMVELVTGLQPDFHEMYNARAMRADGGDDPPMIKRLQLIDTSHRECGNDMVHRVLTQQFNLIKDRLLQNRCFNEDLGTGELCDMAVLSKENVKERTRNESYEQQKALKEALEQKGAREAT